MSFPDSGQAVLAAYGQVAYLIVPISTYADPDLLFATVDGSTWSPRPVPRKKARDESAAAEADGGRGWNDPLFTTDRAGYAVYSPAGNPWGIGQLWRTTDGGATWSPLSFADPERGH
jgi:hypothetical protein